MEKIVWDEAWSLGFERIDLQHKQLISLINRITFDEIKIKELIGDLIDYTSLHFGDEEALMFEYCYTQDLFSAHKEEHRKFTNTLLEVSFVLGDDINEELVEKFKRVSVTWFKVHFLGTDKLLVDFIKGGDDCRRL